MNKPTFDKLLIATSQFDKFELSDLDLLRDWLESSSREVTVSIDDQFSQLELSELVANSKNVDLLQPIAKAPRFLEVAKEFEIFSEEFQSTKSGTSIMLSSAGNDRMLRWETSMPLEKLVKQSNFLLLQKILNEESLLAKLQVNTVHKSINRVTDYFQVEFSLSDTGVEAYETAMAIFKAYGFKGLGENFTAVIEKFNVQDIGFTITFSGADIYNLGMIFNKPSREITLFLGGLSPEFSDEKLAIVEAALGAKKPSKISYTMDSRWGMKCFYSPLD